MLGPLANEGTADEAPVDCFCDDVCPDLVICSMRFMNRDLKLADITPDMRGTLQKNEEIGHVVPECGRLFDVMAILQLSISGGPLFTLNFNIKFVLLVSYLFFIDSTFNSLS